MKKFLIVTLFVLAATLGGLQAQKPGDRSETLRTDYMAEMVGNLSCKQKKQLDALYNEMKPRIFALKQNLEEVRDSIAVALNVYGDNSAKLFPLFDREAQLQAEVSREYYRTKVAIDNILTKEQYKTFMRNRERQRKQTYKGH